MRNAGIAHFSCRRGETVCKGGSALSGRFCDGTIEQETWFQTYAQRPALEPRPWRKLARKQPCNTCIATRCQRARWMYRCTCTHRKALFQAARCHRPDRHFNHHSRLPLSERHGVDCLFGGVSIPSAKQAGCARSQQ